MKVEPIRDKDLIRDCMSYLDHKNPRNKMLFALGIYTGLRISDILNLKVKDVYCKNRIQVKQKKTGGYVYIPINIELKRIIKEYVKDMQPHDYLIKSREGYNRPITRNQAYNILNEMANYFGIENIGTHTMRKSCGYHLYNTSGKDIGLVMQVLGQKDPGSTLRYIGITDMDIDRNMRKLSYL
ncbi:MAG: tyrosine-type recombinase/integrase [Paeniclostridium sp.]